MNHKQSTHQKHKKHQDFLRGNPVRGKTMVDVSPQYYTLLKVQWKIMGMHIHLGTLPRAHCSKIERLTALQKIGILPDIWTDKVASTNA